MSVTAIAIGLFAAAVVWVLYMALEPYLRRRWPQSLISWTRLLAGDVRDPLVAGHILVGIALGVGVGALALVAYWLGWQQRAALDLSNFTLTTLNGAGLTRGLLATPIGTSAIAMGAFFLHLMVRVVLRNTWLASAAFVVLLALLTVASAPEPPGPSFLAAVLYLSLLLWIMIRLGVLPTALFIAISSVMVKWPLTSDLTAWYADKSMIVVALLLALAMWSFRNALAGRKVLKDDLL